MSHVKTAAALEEFLGFCSGYGGSYNPGLPNLKLSALNELAIKARQALEEVNAAKSVWNNATNHREIVFAGLPKLVSSITFTLAASGASEQTMKDARVLLRQMTSRRKSRDPIPSGEGVVQSEKGRPFSQRGFESMTNHFAQLVQLVSMETLYQPTEYHLSVVGLLKHVSKLRSHNVTVKETRVRLSHARLHLYQIYYGDVNSVVVAARSAKKYIRAIFGLNSNEYHQVKKFIFSKTKIR